MTEQNSSLTVKFNVKENLSSCSQLQTTWEVYLPPDDWRHLWNPEKVHRGGGFIIVEAPIGKPPVFYRDKSSWKPLFEDLGRL
jgi:alpha-glucosidase